MADGAFGTLTINTGGEARFVGSFAGSEYLRDGVYDLDGRSIVDGSIELAAPTVIDRDQGSGRTQGASPKAAYRDSALIILDSIAPVAGGFVCSIDALQCQLPDWETEGRMLVDSYWENVNWM